MVLKTWVLVDKNVEKYKTVLVGFNKKDHQMIASLLDLLINYVNYKYKDENINFKVTCAYVIVMLYKNNAVTKKQLYTTIDEYHKHYVENFVSFLGKNGGDINDDNNLKFCEKYIEENG